MRISDWSSDVCSSDLHRDLAGRAGQGVEEAGNREPDPCRRPAVSRAMPLTRLLPDVAAVPPELAITGLVLDRPPITPGDAIVPLGVLGTPGMHFVDKPRPARVTATPSQTPQPDNSPSPTDSHV